MEPWPALSPLAAILAERIARSARTGTTLTGESTRCITFREYMDICLYDASHGYYRSGTAARVGRGGDFYTSAYIGDAMGTTLGAYLFRLAEERFGGGGAPVELVDWGGGTGRLARQMLHGWLSAAEAPGANDEPGANARRSVCLTVVDGNPAHRREAEEALAEERRSGLAAVMDEAEAEAHPWRESPVVVIGNELLDAMPVHRVCMRRGRLLEWGVAWDEAAGKPVPCLTEPSSERLAEMLDAEGTKLREGQTAEIGLAAADWVAGLAGKLGRAILVLIDYGDEAGELTAAHRMDGTLMCYRRHIAGSDPYEAPGEQDITAHVNFTSIREAAGEAGWTTLWYGTQKRFLVEAGLLERLAGHDETDPFHPVARRNRAIRQLLLSDGMSELFKVLILEK